MRQYNCNKIFVKQPCFLFRYKIWNTHKNQQSIVIPSISIWLVFVIFLFYSTSAFAQTISGLVTDKNKSPIEFVTVLLKTGSTSFASALTDSTGSFKFKNLQESRSYTLSLSLIGYARMDTVMQRLPTEKLVLALKEDAVTLKEVSITATTKKPIFERKVDRLIFNVVNSIAAAGGDALDALKVTPLLNVKNDKIAIAGKSGLSLMVDGHPVQLSGEDLINYLHTISADDLQSIEVITTPPAKYDAEGNSGIVNIKLKKGRQNAWNNAIRTSYRQSTYPDGSIGNTFNYRKNKLSLLSSADYRYIAYREIDTEIVYYPNEKWSSVDTRNHTNEIVSGKINADYQITEKLNIGVIVQYNQSKPGVDDESEVSVYNLMDVLTNKLKTNGSSKTTNQNTAFNFHIDQVLDSMGRKVSFNADYFNYMEDIDRIFDTRQFDSNENPEDSLKAKSGGNLNIENYSAKVDIEHPNKWGKLTYGGKVSTTKTNSDMSFYNLTSGTPVLDPLQTDRFEYKENIQAVYLDFSKDLGKKWQLKTGLRYEHTRNQGTSVTNHTEVQKKYGQFFPNAYLSYLINTNNSLNLNYSRRIHRPAYWELNPFRWYLNANSYAEGNPFLQPSFNRENSPSACCGVAVCILY